MEIHFIGRFYFMDMIRKISDEIDHAEFPLHNLYQYNFNHPFRYTDPDGQFAFVIPIIGLAFGLGTASLTIVTVETLTCTAIMAASAWGINEAIKAYRQIENARKIYKFYKDPLRFFRKQPQKKKQKLKRQG